ncbi:MAG TPA: helix-turn-helix domain-containing protein [Mycobacteriales bacterium]|nr:helix-turn-helix domain-containing protein [Mycobacteriales bacterium]
MSSMPSALEFELAHCSIARALELVGEKWTLLVLRDAFNGVRRFDDLHRRIGAPRQVLSARLGRLVEVGLLRRVPYRDPGQRTRYEYRLTESGLDLYPILVSLLTWGDRHRPNQDGPAVELTHRGCGEPIELALRCAAGHDVGSAREVHPRPGPGAVRITPTG